MRDDVKPATTRIVDIIINPPNRDRLRRLPVTRRKGQLLTRPIGAPNRVHLNTTDGEHPHRDIMGGGGRQHKIVGIC